jgi:DNA-binding response OmpR family regulator
LEDPLANFLSPLLKPYSEDEIHSEMRGIARFRRTLRKEDQVVMDDLLVSLNKHWHLRDQMEHLTPLEFMLLGMLIEQNKEIKHLSVECKQLKTLMD